MNEGTDTQTTNEASGVAPATTGYGPAFTPGPWRYQKEITFVVLGSKAPPRVRFEVYKDGGIYGHPATCDSEEDARLIAAAPDLLASLKELLFCYENADETGYIEDVGFIDLSTLQERAHAAIAKATGDHNAKAEPANQIL